MTDISITKQRARYINTLDAYVTKYHFAKQLNTPIEGLTPYKYLELERKNLLLEEKLMSKMGYNLVYTFDYLAPDWLPFSFTSITSATSFAILSIAEILTNKIIVEFFTDDEDPIDWNSYPIFSLAATAISVGYILSQNEKYQEVINNEQLLLDLLSLHEQEQTCDLTELH
jgi:hypothetical protein